MNAAGLLRVLEGGPLIRALFGAALVVALVELVVIIRARRRLANLTALRRQATADPAPPSSISVPSRVAELVAAAGPGVTTAIAVASIQHGRGQIWRAIQSSTPLEEKARILSAGVSEQLNALVTSLWLIPFLVLLACFAVGFAVAARLQAAGLQRGAAFPAGSPEAVAWTRYPGPTADALIGGAILFLVVGLGPLVHGAFVFLVHVIDGFRATAGVDPAEKARVFEGVLDASRADLGQRLLLARGGAVAAVLIVGLIAAFSAPARLRRRLLGRDTTDGRAALVLAGALCAAAVAAWLLAVPMQRENDAPWPPRGNGAVAPRSLPATVALEGPDPAEPAPLVVVTADRLELNGALTDSRTLEGELDVLRNNYDLLHPTGHFNRLLAIACSPEVPAASVVRVLRAGLEPGYTRPELLFLREEHVVRPLIGPLARNLATAVRFSTVARAADADEGATTVKVTDPTCGALAARLLKLRREGKDVALVLPP